MSKDYGQGRDPDTVDWVDLAEQAARGEGPAAKLARRALAKRQAQATAREPPPAPDQPRPRAEVIRLPVWTDTVRGVPNAALRSALFGAIRRGRRTFLQGQKLTSVNGLTVLFTGPRLDQADLDVWEQCLHLARTEGLGCRIHFSAHGFLKAIDRSTGKSQHEWLKNAFRRLAASVVEIQDGRRAYFGPMLHHGARDNATGQYVIEINPAIRSLYGAGGWSQVDWAVRKALAGQPLAQWLHGFYTTHAEPYPYKVETLHGLCGSEMEQLFHFRAELRNALDAVQAAGGIVSWTIDADDLVHVEPVRSAAQQRHLARRGRKPQTFEHDTDQQD